MNGFLKIKANNLRAIIKERETMGNAIGIVGLGRMGLPAGKLLIRKGYTVVGCDRDPGPLDEFVASGGEAASDAKAVAEKADTIIVFVLNDEQVKTVIDGKNGLLAGVREGACIICMSTIRQALLKQIAALCFDKDVAFVDCPCTGGPPRAENGTLTLIAAGKQDAMDRCRPILENLGTIVHVGEAPGMGQAVKHCNQLLVSVTHAAVVEVILMARRAGLDERQVCEVIGSGVGGSDYFKLLSSSIIDKTAAPCAMALMCKDSNIVVDSSRSMQLPLLVAGAANQYFLAAESLGLENEESSELMKVVERFSQPRDSNESETGC
jgi:3-hydroxyisobutyrate dehydrogenase-like beta-hydroxyacid dehydrogenase